MNETKTIDINAKEWFDRINGNSYFSATVTVNFGTETKKEFVLPFQYGYGEHYVQMAKEELEKQGIIKIKKHDALWRYCDNNNIILRTNKQENCLKRELAK